VSFTRPVLDVESAAIDVKFEFSGCLFDKSVTRFVTWDSAIWIATADAAVSRPFASYVIDNADEAEPTDPAVMVLDSVSAPELTIVASPDIATHVADPAVAPGIRSLPELSVPVEGMCR
jgi:hypothetical protein